MKWIWKRNRFACKTEAFILFLKIREKIIYFSSVELVLYSFAEEMQREQGREKENYFRGIFHGSNPIRKSFQRKQTGTCNYLSIIPSRWWNLCPSCSQTVQLLCCPEREEAITILLLYTCSSTPMEILACGWWIQTIRTIHKEGKCFLFPVLNILPSITTTTMQLLPDLLLLSLCHLSHKWTSKRNHWKPLAQHHFWHTISPVCSDWPRDASHSLRRL